MWGYVATGACFGFCSTVFTLYAMDVWERHRLQRIIPRLPAPFDDSFQVRRANRQRRKDPVDPSTCEHKGAVALSFPAQIVLCLNCMSMEDMPHTWFGLPKKTSEYGELKAHNMVVQPKGLLRR